MTEEEKRIISLLHEINRSLVKAIRLMEFLVGEKIKNNSEKKGNKIRL